MNLEIPMKKIKGKIQKETQEAKKKGETKIFFFFDGNDFTTEEMKNRKQIIEECNRRGWFGDIWPQDFNLSYQPERIK